MGVIKEALGELVMDPAKEARNAVISATKESLAKLTVRPALGVINWTRKSIWELLKGTGKAALSIPAIAH